MGRDTGIANRLRSAGLRVIEVDAWQTRGSTDFDPRGSVNHHTAGPSSGATPSLNTCIHGRPDLAGPLCNVFQSREPDGRDIAYVVAAGRANHAGEGGWNGLTGNRSMYGLEVEHTGTSALPQGRIDISAAIHAAMFGGDVANVCQHYEWTTRKIDAATNVSGDDFRKRVKAAREPEPEPPKPKPMEGEGMFTLFYVEETQRYYTMTPWHIGKIAIEDGYLLDSKSSGLYAVVVPTNECWNEIAAGAPGT